MSNDSLVQLLILLACGIFLGIIFLIFVLIIIRFREKKIEQAKKSKEEDVYQVKKSAVIYTPESIFDFMNFEKIEDNMIIQKRGKFLMVVECQGINYDLMSEIEKVSVEQGFIAFLNSLRFPVQLYVQTRTINLERSVEGYKNKLKEIERKYNNLKIEYEKLLKDETNSKQTIDKVKYELVKQRNLKDYTADIIKDIERQSLNKNILSKKYYVIVPCYQSEIEAGDFDKTEVQNMAFSELYTRARAIINSLFTCQVSGKILNSEELTELLYIAYNRDESDLFWMEKMKEAGFEELYSTAPDVIDKKIKLLDKQIEDKSIKLANEKISEVKREKDIEAIEKETKQEEIVGNKAKELLRKHKKYIGEEVAQRAIEKINEETTKDKRHIAKVRKNKEETLDGNIQEKGTRGKQRRKA